MREIYIVLVRPKYSRNVGSAARVMSNMGASQLILVDPQCDIDFSAYEGAAGAPAFLRSAKSYHSMQAFYKSEQGLRIAFTSRRGRSRQTTPFKEKLTDLIQRTEFFSSPIYLLFGPEDHGLSEKDMNQCHAHCSLPIYGEFKSLNLSHALLLALFILKDKLNESTLRFKGAEEVSPLPEELLKRWLITTGFNLNSPRTNAFHVLRKWLYKSMPTKKELSVLTAALEQNIRKLNELN